MTGKQHAILWLGLLLIITRLFTTNQWKVLWGTVSSTGSSQPNANSPGSSFNPFGILHVGPIPIPFINPFPGVVPSSPHLFANNKHAGNHNLVV